MRECYRQRNDALRGLLFEITIERLLLLLLDKSREHTCSLSNSYRRTKWNNDDYASRITTRRDPVAGTHVQYRRRDLPHSLRGEREGHEHEAGETVLFNTYLA